MTWVLRQLVLVTFVGKLERIYRTLDASLIIKAFNLYEISVDVLIILLVILRDNYFLNCPFQIPRLYYTVHVSIFQAIRDGTRQPMEIPGSWMHW